MGVLHGDMSIHELERVGNGQDDGDRETEQRGRELFETAVTVLENQRVRTALDLFISGDIHQYAGGSLRALDGSKRIFWHDRGTFVAKNGAIYHLRADDEETPQVYVAPVDDRGGNLYCIQPVTYDGYRSSDGAEMRFDFINNIHHALPKNSFSEIEQQRQGGFDVMRPPHQTGAAFDDRRDSISVTSSPNGTVRAMLHDSETGLIEYLYDAAEIKSLVELLDTLK